MAMVLHEEQRPMCSNTGNHGGGGGGRGSAGGSRSSKKNKQRKTPQRGMGVAQLEELRIREQQMTTAVASSSCNPSSGLALPPMQQPSLPFFPAADGNKPLFHPAVDLNPLSDFFIPNPTLPHALESSAIAGLHGPNAVVRKCSLLASLQSDSLNSNWRPPGLLQRRQHQQQISVANKRLSPQSSGVNLQMEPPSNQIYSSDYHLPPAWPEEERIVGMKRQWPFHPDNLSGLGGFPCKVPMFSSSFLKPDESLPMHRNGSIKYEPKCPVFKDGNSSSGTNHNDKIPRGTIAATNDGFPTLGLSVIPSIPKSKSPFSPPHLAECTKFDLPPYQGSTDDAILQPGVSSEQPFYNFLPMGPSDLETNSNERWGEALDSVDLNLKL